MTKPAGLTGDEMRFFTARHADRITFADVSADGALAATASADRTARIWQRASRQPQADPLAHQALVNCVRFSADGAVIGTSSADRRVRVWDATSGLAITDWIRCRFPVAQVWFGSNATFVVTDERELWPLYTARAAVPDWLPELAEAIAGV